MHSENAEQKFYQTSIDGVTNKRCEASFETFLEVATVTTCRPKYFFVVDLKRRALYALCDLG